MGILVILVTFGCVAASFAHYEGTVVQYCPLFRKSLPRSLPACSHNREYPAVTLMNFSLTWQKQPTSAGWGAAFPRVSPYPKAHTAIGRGRQLSKHLPSSLLQMPLPKAPSPLTRGTRAALPPQKQLDVKTWKGLKFMAFHILIFPTYHQRAGLSDVQK